MNLLNVMNAERTESILTIEFVKSNLMTKLVRELQPVLSQASAVMYPKGTPADCIKSIKDLCCMHPAVVIEESKILDEYVKASNIKDATVASFWIDKGYTPSDNEDLEFVAGMYTQMTELRKNICEHIGINNVSKDFVLYLRSQGAKSND